MRFAALAVVLILAIGAFWWSRTPPSEAAPDPGGEARVVDGTADRSQPPSQQSAAAVTPLDPDRPRPADGAAIQLPDGMSVPVLNGAIGAKPPTWPRDYPYAKLIGTQSDAESGLDWYVHEDGSKWTTRMVWRQDLNRYDPMTSLRNPTTAVPMADPTVDTPPSGR